jgi:hypothetical protein
MFAPELADGTVKAVMTDWTLPALDLWAVYPPAGRGGARRFVPRVEQAAGNFLGRAAARFDDGQQAPGESLQADPVRIVAQLFQLAKRRGVEINPRSGFGSRRFGAPRRGEGWRPRSKAKSEGAERPRDPASEDRRGSTASHRHLRAIQADRELHSVGLDLAWQWTADGTCSTL